MKKNEARLFAAENKIKLLLGNVFEKTIYNKAYNYLRYDE